MNNSVKILIAEDHKLLRQLLISSLEEYKIITIGEAEDGYQLLELLKRTKPDIVLLDIEMPYMNGSETFNKIKILYPELKVIFLSTHAENTLIDHFYEKGVDAYVTKNTDMNILAETIQQVHENKFKRAYKVSNEKFDQGLKFSKREAEIIPLICEGKSNNEIAGELEIGSKSIEAHKKNLFKKTKTKSTAGFINYVVRKGLHHMSKV